VGTLAFGIVIAATASPGPGLDPDAMSYLGAAKTIVRSGVYRVPTSSWAASDTSEPLSHFPPGFSTAIAVPVAAGLSPVEGARLLVALAAFGTWTGLVLLVAGAVGTRVGMMTALAALATPALLNVHLSVLSEPLFLTALVATLAGIVTMADPRLDARGRRRGAGIQAAAWTGLAVAAAVMLRYVGISLVAAAAVAALWGPGIRRRRWGARLVRSILVVAPAACALGAWLIRSTRLAGSTSVRALGVYGGLGGTMREGLRTATDWLVPAGTGDWRGPVAIALAIGGVGLAVNAWHERRRGGARVAWLRQNPAIDPRRSAVLLAAAALTGTAYLVVVVASRVLADPNIPFDERILSPLILLVEIALGVGLARWWPGRARAAQLSVAAVVAAWFVASVVTSSARVVYAREEGNDFAGSDWRESPTLAWVTASDGGATRALYSNWPAALYFRAGRASHDLPDVTDALTLRRFRERLARSHGVLVGFTSPNGDVASPDSIARILALHVIARFTDGTVWGLASDSAASH
jgi:hypothetical protein